MGGQKRILIVGAQHGDERLGPRLFSFLKKNNPKLLASVDYICGNPKAYHANVRYTESDLNRSYTPANYNLSTYEERRAQKILKYISARNYDFVLDVHTSTSDVGCFFLATGLSETVRQIVSSSRITRVAIMPAHIADCSLIGQVAQAISIEYNRKLARNRQTLIELTEMLQNLVRGSTGRKQYREIYYVQDVISPDTDLGVSARNFEKSKDGCYPILYGEKNYKGYRGFAATRKKVMDL